MLTPDSIAEKVRQVVTRPEYRDSVRRVRLFGSYLHGKAKKKSDVDLIVDLRGTIGLFEFVGLQLDLKKVLRRNVDLVTPHSLSKYIRKEVLSTAHVLYKQPR